VVASLFDLISLEMCVWHVVLPLGHDILSETPHHT